jgi:hypothetical protein
MVQQAQPPQEPKAEVPPVEKESPAAFVATEDLYKKTFSEVQETVAALTKIISSGDYAQWVSFLTEAYVQSRSNAEFLATTSNAGVLKKSGIVLKSLQDYFEQVVRPARIQVAVDDITFIDATHVKAIMQIQGNPVIIYYLEREDARWKVSILLDGDK